MHSSPNLLLCVALFASYLQLSRAAPAVTCVVSQYLTTYAVEAKHDSTPAATFQTEENIIATSADPPALIVTTAAKPLATKKAKTPSSSSTIPTLPSNGGSTELPSPTATIKFVTVGRGVQNYSCSAAGAVPAAIGAVATLYDFTSLASDSETILNTVPPIVVYMPISSCSGSTLTISGVGTFPQIGHHYFGSDGTPTFSLSAVNDVLFGAKIASVSAPAGADSGPDGTGAVPWLMLADKGGSVGVSQVYRVVTAGGKAPATCPDTNLISIQYAAEYWFFG